MREWLLRLVSHWGGLQISCLNKHTVITEGSVLQEHISNIVKKIMPRPCGIWMNDLCFSVHLCCDVKESTLMCLRISTHCLCLFHQRPGRLFSTSYPSLPQWRMPNWLCSSSVSVTHQQGKQPFFSPSFNSLCVTVSISICMFYVTAYHNHYL